MTPRISPGRTEKLTSSKRPAEVRPSTSSSGSASSRSESGGGVSLSARPVIATVSAERSNSDTSPATGDGAVAQHRDPLRELQHLLELVADEDEGDAVLLELLHDAEQRLDLAPRQRRRRLVHEDDRAPARARGRSRSAAGRPRRGPRRARRGRAVPRCARRPRRRCGAARPGGSCGGAARCRSTPRCSPPPTGSGTARTWKITWIPSASAWRGVRCA